MRRRAAVLGLLLAFAPIAEAVAADDARVVRFGESKTPFPNPERGFYAPRMADRMDRLDGLRGRRITLLLVELDLRDFKDRELSPAKLGEAAAAFEAARQHGLKVIFRAAYGFTGRDYRADPKDLARIAGHIRQLGDVFRAHRDVLFAVQAGFLGPWGEWHGSNWGDPPSIAARRAVLFGLLDAAPAPIPVQIRRPMFVRDLFEGEPGGADLDDARAFDGSRLARTGWHNDAMLSLPTDMGTYAQPGWDRARELAWSARHGKFTVFGGETVPGSAKMPLDQVVRELEQLHATYLNSGYHRGTLEGWRAGRVGDEDGYAHVERRLGYRLAAETLRVGPAPAPGRGFRVALTIRNVGFAAPMGPRGVAFVLTRGERSTRVDLEKVDPRRWAPEAGPVTLEATLPIPDDGTGPSRLALHLPDPSPTLRDDPRYAVRLSGEGVRFDDATGLNVLVDDLTPAD